MAEAKRGIEGYVVTKAVDVGPAGCDYEYAGAPHRGGPHDPYDEPCEVYPTLTEARLARNRFEEIEPEGLFQVYPEYAPEAVEEALRPPSYLRNYAATPEGRLDSLEYRASRMEKRVRQLEEPAKPAFVRPPADTVEERLAVLEEWLAPLELRVEQLEEAPPRRADGGESK